MFDDIELGLPEINADDNLILIEDNNHSFITSILNSDDLEINYLEEIHLLHDLAKKLGVENTRKHLVPYLTHLIICEKISALKDLAIILGDFECCIGGPKYAHILLLPLEKLAGSKLSDVRMTAIKSLQVLADIMEVPDLETYFIPLIANMAINDNCHTRWSVCHLLSTVYMRVSQKYQNDLINYHCLMSFDSFSFVRKGAANMLVDLSEIVHLSIFDSKLIPRLEQFSFDQNEQVRILSLSAALSISNSYDVSYVKKIILPFVLNFINEPSSKAHLILIKNIAQLLNIGVSCLKLTEKIMQVLIVLSKDQHLEVRLQSINTLYDCCVILYKNMDNLEANKFVCKFLMPTLCELSQDKDDKCKLAVPAVLAKFRKLIPSEVIKDYFVNLVKELLNDKNIDVVFNVVKYMRDILGSQYCNFIVLPEDRLICCLKALIINESCEIRNMGAIYLGILATHMGLQFFEEYLEQSFLLLLSDSESIVQQTVINVFKLLIEKFEMDWAQKCIVSYLVKQTFSRNTCNKIIFPSFAKICATIMCIKYRTKYQYQKKFSKIMRC